MEAQDRVLGLVLEGVSESDWKWRYICAKLRAFWKTKFWKSSFQPKINRFQEIEIDLFKVRTKNVKLFLKAILGFYVFKIPRPSFRLFHCKFWFNFVSTSRLLWWFDEANQVKMFKTL